MVMKSPYLPGMYCEMPTIIRTDADNNLPFSGGLTFSTDPRTYAAFLCIGESPDMYEQLCVVYSHGA